uniref:AAA+ ATPase domain-containing protein n=1 Tax=viral metagenome TaxID=1070528 RepID=A0A6C0ASC1_9ZZZZ
MSQLPIHDKIYEKLDFFHKSNKIPHIIFHGSTGSGKRTIINNFIDKIYNGDKQKIKTNVMFVNCAHGKGIKFIREELKFFAKTNIQANNGLSFKSIVLINAEFLTIDAQSALRRCIELFSYNTRFFIVVENKQKLLNPILSRFCEIYVPEYVLEDGQIQNLHHLAIHKNFNISTIQTTTIEQYLGSIFAKYQKDRKSIEHGELVDVANELYENACSCLDLIEWIKQRKDIIGSVIVADACLWFDKIKSEYRCEKLLMLYLLDYLFIRSNKDAKSVLAI